MRIKKSKLLLAFENLIEELEKRPLKCIDVHAIHTRLSGQPAYVLSIPKNGLFVILTALPNVPHGVKLITLRVTDPWKEEADGTTHVLREDEIGHMAFITTQFFYDGVDTELAHDLHHAFPEFSRFEPISTSEPNILDLREFMS